MMENIKEILKEHSEEIKRHMDVIKEDTDDKIEVLTEGQEAIREKLDSHDVKFTSIENKLDSHDVKFTSMERNIEIIKNDIEIIKNSLKKKVDIEDFEQLEGRVRVLEAKVK